MDSFLSLENKLREAAGGLTFPMEPGEMAFPVGITTFITGVCLFETVNCFLLG
jgi:hypothetical protein